MRSEAAQKQEPDKAWVWIVAAGVAVVLAFCGASYLFT